MYKILRVEEFRKRHSFEWRELQEIFAPLVYLITWDARENEVMYLKKCEE